MKDYQDPREDLRLVLIVGIAIAILIIATAMAVAVVRKEWRSGAAGSGLIERFPNPVVKVHGGGRTGPGRHLLIGSPEADDVFHGADLVLALPSSAFPGSASWHSNHSIGLYPEIFEFANNFSLTIL